MLRVICPPSALRRRCALALLFVVCGAFAACDKPDANPAKQNGQQGTKPPSNPNSPVGSFLLNTSPMQGRLQTALMEAKKELAAQPNNPNPQRVIGELTKLIELERSRRWSMKLEANGTWTGQESTKHKDESAEGTWVQKDDAIILTPTKQNGKAVKGGPVLNFVLEAGDLVLVARTPDGQEQARLRFARQ